MARRNRRNSFKETYWRKQLSRQASSGLSIAGWCRRHNFSNSLFYFWKKTIAERDGCLSESTPHGAMNSVERVPFARVRLIQPAETVDPAARMATGREAVERTGGLIEILLSDGLAVRVRPGFDEPTLGRVLEILKDRSC